MTQNKEPSSALGSKSTEVTIIQAYGLQECKKIIEPLLIDSISYPSIATSSSNSFGSKPHDSSPSNRLYWLFDNFKINKHLLQLQSATQWPY